MKKSKNATQIEKNKDILLVAGTTILILLVPFVGMFVGDDWNWGLADFVIGGGLIFGIGSIFVIAARKIKNHNQRVLIGSTLLFILLFIWAQLAVGLF